MMYLYPYVQIQTFSLRTDQKNLRMGLGRKRCDNFLGGSCITMNNILIKILKLNDENFVEYENSSKQNYW